MMKRLAVLSAVPALLLLFGMEEAALADHLGSIRNSRRFRVRERIEIRDYDALRLQREAISAAEEARREAGRKERRDELEQELEKEQSEFLESQAAIRSESLAARNAPRGFYYRKPGTRTGTLPGGAVKIEVDGKTYHYFKGVFYRPGPGAYTVVTAPPGARIDELPEGHMMVTSDEQTYFYYFGSYYRRDGDGYVVTRPLKGAVVSYLPDGYDTLRSESGTLYSFGGIRYKPYYREGIVVYAVQGI
jgi:hypothetical protein